LQKNALEETMKKLRKFLLILLIVLAVLFLVLIAPRTIGSASLEHMQGYHYTHRGYHDGNVNIPENSLSSFAAAIDAGYGIELDVQLSSDKVPMVIHDADLMRICGVQGKVWDYTCAELQQMKLFGTDETIPTLAETLALIDGQVPILLEYKMDKVDTDVCAYSHEILKDYDGPYAIQCFHPFALLWYEAKAPHVARGILARDFVAEKIADGKEPSILDFALSHMLFNFAMEPDFISYNFEDADHPAMQCVQLLGGKTACWTLKSQENYESVKDPFDMYIFDSFALEY
jgi:glycerophosphoryl diester phosphodiesterase